MIIFKTDECHNVTGVEITFDRPITRDDLPDDLVERRDFVVARAKMELGNLAQGELGEYGEY